LRFEKTKLIETVKKNEQTELECLRNLVSIPTSIAKNHNMQPIISKIKEEFEKRGYIVQIFPTSGVPVIVAEMNLKKEKTLLFYNHFDVQPEDPLEDWNFLPYELSNRNGRLYGRGVRDNKGPFVANLFGVQSAFESGYGPNCNIRFILEGEEEIGSPYFAEFCRAHPELLRADGCVWEGSNAVPNQHSKIYAGVKGEIYFDLVAKGFSKDAHSGDAPIVVNPAWRLVWALSTLKNLKEEILVDGFYDDVIPPTKEDLTLFASYPEEWVKQYRKKYETNKFLMGREGVEFWKELSLRPTCTICGISSGWTGSGSKTVVGKEAIAKLDIRIVPNQKVEKVKKMLREHLDKHGFSDIKTRFLAGYPYSKIAIDNPFIILLKKLAEHFSGKTAYIIPSLSGSGPAYLLDPKTPWGSSFTFDPKANVHAPNESLSLNDLRYRTVFNAAISIELS
jgi:acetylornithine deacetylase/succinyl-diaminopimelate desuccinylase-like protein